MGYWLIYNANHFEHHCSMISIVFHHINHIQKVLRTEDYSYTQMEWNAVCLTHSYSLLSSFPRAYSL